MWKYLANISQEIVNEVERVVEICMGQGIQE